MFISVIIPMRNEERYVSKCLDSVLAQLKDNKDVEVICVEGGSVDRTRELVEEYSRRDTRVRLVDNPAGIVPVGMNRGIQACRGDIIIRLDCHATYASDYIAKCVEVLERTGADNVGGYVKTLPGSNSAVGRAIAVATSSRFGVGGSVFRTGGAGEQEVDAVPFGCFRRSLFDRLGLYDERLVRNQDLELNSRIRKNGGKIIISSEIQCTYYNRSTFAGLRQQAFFNGLWNPYTLYLTGGNLRPRHLIPLVFVVSLIVLSVAGLFWWPARLLYALEVAAYVLVGGVMAWRASRVTHTSAILVFLGFLQLHLAYGVGSLWGVLFAPFKFGFRRRNLAMKAIADRRD